MASIRAIGIDPGSRITGVGVIESKGQSLQFIYGQSIRTGNGSLASKLLLIHNEIRKVVDKYNPTHGAIEKVFVSTNPRSALVLGQARGAAILALSSFGIDVHEYTALQTKRSITGTGGAGKAQVQHMVRILLGMNYIPPQDTADALACAICHLHTIESARNINVYEKNERE